VAVAAPQVGPLLREWRRRRRVSQLELASGSAVSSRHLSFIETGRAKPSREMVLHLAERLEVPLRERNRLLLAAGFAPVFGEHALEEETMAPVRDALERFLAAHEPYPAVVVDRGWEIVRANGAVAVLLEGVAPWLLERPNALRITLHPDGMAPRIVNFAEWSGHLLDRLHRELLVGGDAEVAELHDELAGYPGVTSSSEPDGDARPGDVVLPLRLRHGARELVFFSTVTTFGTPRDVTLAELSVEAFYPADTETRAALPALAEATR
jgi:transcriptional regulator with XRE-family HTH domain